MHHVDLSCLLLHLVTLHTPVLSLLNDSKHVVPLLDSLNELESKDQ